MFINSITKTSWRYYLTYWISAIKFFLIRKKTKEVYFISNTWFFKLIPSMTLISIMFSYNFATFYDKNQIKRQNGDKYTKVIYIYVHWSFFVLWAFIPRNWPRSLINNWVRANPLRTDKTQDQVANMGQYPSLSFTRLSVRLDIIQLFPNLSFQQGLLIITSNSCN